MADQVQHYLPRFLLKHFRNEKTKSVHVFDKQTGKSFAASPNNVAAEKGFYDVTLGEFVASMEPSLAKLESTAAEVVSKLRQTENMRVVSQAERGILAHFIAVQMVRTRAAREMQKSLGATMATKLREQAATPEQSRATDEFIGPPPSEEDEKLFAIRFMRDASSKFAPLLALKDWLLCRPDSNDRFVVGDHGVGRHNMNDLSPRGNLGLMSPGIEIYLPLSPQLALAMWCPTLLAEVQQGLSQIHGPKPKPALELLKAVESGTPLSFRPENVTYANSLQIRAAERFVFSCHGDFSLAKEMVSDHPHMRVGERYEVC